MKYFKNQYQDHVWVIVMKYFKAQDAVRWAPYIKQSGKYTVYCYNPVESRWMKYRPTKMKEKEKMLTDIRDHFIEITEEELVLEMI